MNDSNTYPFFFSQIPAAPWSLQSEGISIQYDDVQPDIVMDTATPACCERACGAFIPLVVNGNYNDPNGGRNYIGLALSASPECGIPVSRVLNGNLEGLIGRDDVVVLNPKSNSIRLRIEVSRPSLSGPPISSLLSKVARLRTIQAQGKNKRDTLYTLFSPSLPSIDVDTHP